jgi:hypothetical protein
MMRENGAGSAGKRYTRDSILAIVIDQVTNAHEAPVILVR